MIILNTRRNVLAAVIPLATLLAGCGTSASNFGSRTAADSSAASSPGQEMLDHEEYAPQNFNTESYDHIIDNPFHSAAQTPLSTFSVDVDTASYSNVRRFLSQGQLPPPGAVRIEELINYFHYDDRPPEGDRPFRIAVEVAGCPWRTEHRLVRIGLKGREIPQSEHPPANLVFLLDVSGSMSAPDKLPLVKSAMRLLVGRLDEKDRLAIVVYAGSSGLVLPSTSASQKHVILAALDQLEAGGSTNGGEGIELAYRIAAENSIDGGTNRVILCTDGDFNVGVTNHSELVRLIQQKAATGVFLSVLGFGTGNLKDSTMERLANKGNGNYAYVDTLNEARKVLVERMAGTLITIAKDVKIQVDFNPARVGGYRLIGYENRLLHAQDFQDDAKDAGEIGAGHTVTALYELVPAGLPVPQADVEPSKYQQPTSLSSASESAELLTVRLRYKLPEGAESVGFAVPVVDDEREFAEASADFRFASAVAAFGMLLRDSPHRGTATFDTVEAIASTSLGSAPSVERTRFLELVCLARDLSR